MYKLFFTVFFSLFIYTGFACENDFQFFQNREIERNLDDLEKMVERTIEELDNAPNLFHVSNKDGPSNIFITDSKNTENMINITSNSDDDIRFYGPYRNEKFFYFIKRKVIVNANGIFFESAIQQYTEFGKLVSEEIIEIKPKEHIEGPITFNHKGEMVFSVVKQVAKAGHQTVSSAIMFKKFGAQSFRMISAPPSLSAFPVRMNKADTLEDGRLVYELTKVVSKDSIPFADLEKSIWLFDPITQKHQQLTDNELKLDRDPVVIGSNTLIYSSLTVDPSTGNRKNRINTLTLGQIPTSQNINSSQDDREQASPKKLENGLIGYREFDLAKNTVDYMVQDQSNEQDLKIYSKKADGGTATVSSLSKTSYAILDRPAVDRGREKYILMRSGPSVGDRSPSVQRNPMLSRNSDGEVDQYILVESGVPATAENNFIGRFDLYVKKGHRIYGKDFYYRKVRDKYINTDGSEIPALYSRTGIMIQQKHASN